MSHAADSNAGTRVVDPLVFVKRVMDWAASLDALPSGTITPHLADDAIVLLKDRAALAREVRFQPMTPEEVADFVARHGDVKQGQGASDCEGCWNVQPIRINDLNRDEAAIRLWCERMRAPLTQAADAEGARWRIPTDTAARVRDAAQGIATVVGAAMPRANATLSHLDAASLDRRFARLVDEMRRLSSLAQDPHEQLRQLEHAQIDATKLHLRAVVAGLQPTRIDPPPPDTPDEALLPYWKRLAESLEAEGRLRPIARVTQGIGESGVHQILTSGGVNAWINHAVELVEELLAELRAAARQTAAAAVTLSGRDFQEWAGGPTATLAIVFTDIVDSTALNVELGNAAMGQVRIAHFAQVRKLIQFYNGYEMKTIGDSFMVAFRSAAAGLSFALELSSDPGHTRVKVRAGLHVGPVDVHAGDAFGTMVNYAHRVMSCSKGAVSARLTRLRATSISRARLSTSG